MLRRWALQTNVHSFSMITKMCGGATSGIVASDDRKTLTRVVVVVVVWTSLGMRHGSSTHTVPATAGDNPAGVYVASWLFTGLEGSQNLPRGARWGGSSVLDSPRLRLPLSRKARPLLRMSGVPPPGRALPLDGGTRKNSY